MDNAPSLKAAKELAGSHLVTTCAAFAALFVFVPLGQRIVVATFDGLPTSPSDRQLGIALLLNIALILFAWRRSKDLKTAMAANETARQSAHDNAFADHVTGLPNRRELMRMLGEPGLSACESKLILLDLDFFKKVNDLYGHVVGDEVLRAAAQIIRKLAPPDSCCARLGGDEFAILVRGKSDAVIGQTMAAIIHAIAQPMSCKLRRYTYLLRSGSRASNRK